MKKIATAKSISTRWPRSHPERQHLHKIRIIALRLHRQRFVVDA
jgi:hypothetical protein